MSRFAIFMFLISFFPVFAQQTLWLDENFDNKDRGWGYWDNAKNSSQVADGVWTLNAKTETFYTSTVVYMDPEKDFVIETAIRYNYGEDNNAIGLLFGAKDGMNFNLFSISGNGYYKIEAHGSDTKWVTIKDWTEDDIVKPSGEWNILRVEKKSGIYTFLVNGAKVHEASNIKWYANRLGTSNYAKANYSMDYIRVWQDNRIDLIDDPLTGVRKENLGPNVNTSNQEFVPLITPDGNTIYYTITTPQNTGGEKDGYDIYYSSRQSDGSWGKYKNAGRPLNNDNSNWVISVTPDNQTMMVANCYNPDGSSNGSGISITTRKGDQWQVPVKVEIKNFENISGYNQFYLTQDRKTLLLGAGPKSQYSYGDNDLYVSFLQPDSTWSEPKNLGKKLNTPYAESTPFLASDGVTLYFASEGHPGYGDHDIFMTKRLDDTWENWSEPKNLGSGINSMGGDEGFSIPASGDYAIMTSTYQSLGSSDIIKVSLPKAARSRAVALVYGKVYNSKTKAPISADINYNDLGNNKELGLARSDFATGEYKIVLPTGYNYSFLATEKGFYSISESFDLTGLGEYKEIEKDLYLTPIEKGVKIRLNNLFFDTGKWDLREESFAELGRLVTLLESNAAIHINIEGHTDDVGKDDANLLLSDNRAKAVKEYLVAKGINVSRLKSKGHGEKQPARKNDTEENRQYNRRVEFTIISD